MAKEKKPDPQAEAKAKSEAELAKDWVAECDHSGDPVPVIEKGIVIGHSCGGCGASV